jgi:hypothetical protein
MIDSLQQFVSGLPVWLQWLAIIAMSAVPFIESYLGASIGVLVGMNPLLAALLAVVGNTASMLVVVHIARAVRVRRNGVRRADANQAPNTIQEGARPAALLGSGSLPAVSILGQLAVASHVVAAAQIGKGTEIGKVVFWQVVSIALWAKVFALVTAILIS